MCIVDWLGERRTQIIRQICPAGPIAAFVSSSCACQLYSQCCCKSQTRVHAIPQWKPYTGKHKHTFRNHLKRSFQIYIILLQLFVLPHKKACMKTSQTASTEQTLHTGMYLRGQLLNLLCIVVTLLIKSLNKHKTQMKTFVHGAETTRFCFADNSAR